MKREHIVVSILLIFVLISGVFYAWTNSITTDELTHITTGYINLRFHDYRFNIEHPPLVKQLAALPLLFMRLNFPTGIYRASIDPMDIVKIQKEFLFKLGNDLDLMLIVSRLPNILITLLLGVFIYTYSKKLNGALAGIFSLILFVFSPTFLAHTPLVTMDTTVTCFYFITVYFLMRFIETRRNLFLTLTGIFLGLSMISKFSSLILIPAIGALLILSVFNSFNPSDYDRLKKYLFLLPLLIFACSYKDSFKIMVFAWAPFVIFSIFKKITFSEKFRYIFAVLLIILTIASAFVIMDYTNFKWFPLHGATKAYCKGFSSFDGQAHGDLGKQYLLGRFYDRGKWYYFPLAFIFKEPVALLIIIPLGFIGLFLKKEDKMFKLILTVPLIAYLFAAMFINQSNIGVRHILPAYPFLFVIGGYCVTLARRFKPMAFILTALIVILTLDVVAAYPSHLSYFSRIVGGTNNGYKYLSDSNIAWGQDVKRLRQYVINNNIPEVTVSATFNIDKNCTYYKIPYRFPSEEENILPKKGVYIIEPTMIVYDIVKWGKKIKPVYRVGGSLFVYNITDKEINFLKAK